MLVQYAWQFFLLGRFLDDICRKMDLPPPPSLPSSPPVNILAATFGGSLTERPTSSGLASVILSAEWLTDQEKKDVTELLQMLDGCCKRIEILKVSAEISRTINAAQYAKKSEINIRVSNVRDRIVEELEDCKFLHIPTQKVDYYNAAHLFGADVTRKMPKISEDISQAGTCYALGLNTACVFHLMRALEYCVQRLGKKLKVNISVASRSWAEIVDHINLQVRALPSGKKHTKAQNVKKQRFSLAASRLDHVRIVWRNDVMHPKATYDESEAFEVLTAVDAFLKSVVDLL